jgi:predicted extracellular nuclease
MPIRLVRSAVSAAVLALLAACAPAERTAGPELSPSAPRLQAAVTPAKIVISQVYGGGGNTGATYRNDFIELFNAGGTAQDVSGWSVQYASATGTSWAVTPIPAGTSIAPGKYLLVQQAQGVGGTQSLPTPEVTGTVAMGAGAGKVALVSGSAALTGSCPTAGVVDFVGFGTTANCFEGSGATRPARRCRATRRPRRTRARRRRRRPSRSR